MANIIILEPDTVLADLYTETLVRKGHEVVTAVTAQEAIHQADICKPDIVLLELQLARHNGVEFLYEFRSYPEWQQVPIIILSNTSPDEAISENLRQSLGITACYYKPEVTLRRLVSVVQQALALNTSHAS